MFDETRMYRPDEVAKKMQINKRTVYRMIDNNEIKAVKVRGQLRIWGSELNRYMDENIADPMGLKEIGQ